MVSQKRKEIRLYIFFIVLTLINFEISYFNNLVKGVSYVYFSFQTFEVFILLLLFLKNKKINYFDILLFVFLLIELVSTFLNGLNMIPLFRNYLLILTLYFSTKFGLVTNSKLYIKAVARTLISLTLLNTVSAILCYPNPLFTDGISPYFFLGGDNTSIRIYIITILYAFLYNKSKHSKVSLITYISIINMLLFSIIRDIGTGKVCIIIIIFLMFIFEKINMKMPKNIIKKILIVNAIIFFTIVLEQNLEIFSYLIVNVLNRNLSLTDRTTIWEITIEKIKDHPFLGNGFISGESFEKMLPSIIGVNAHNTYLMLAYIGGITLLFVFVCMFVLVSKKYDKISHLDVMKILPIILFTLMIRAQLEGADTSYLILILSMFYYYDLIEKNYYGGDYNVKNKKT